MLNSPHESLRLLDHSSFGNSNSHFFFSSCDAVVSWGLKESYVKYLCTVVHSDWVFALHSTTILLHSCGSSLEKLCPPLPLLSISRIPIGHHITGKGGFVSTTVEEDTALSNKNVLRKKRYSINSIRCFGVELTPDNVAVAMVYFVQGVLGLARLAVNFYLKDDLHLDPAEVIKYLIRLQLMGGCSTYLNLNKKYRFSKNNQLKFPISCLRIMSRCCNTHIRNYILLNANGNGLLWMLGKRNFVIFLCEIKSRTYISSD